MCCPATTNRRDQTAGLCQQVRPASLPRAEHRGRTAITSRASATRTPRPSTRPANTAKTEMARRLDPFAGLKPLVLICHCPPLRDAARPGPAKACTPGSRSVARVPRRAPAGGLLLRPHPRGGRGRRRWSGTRALQRRPRGYLLEFDYTQTHDDRRTRTRIPSAPPAGRSCAELSLTPPHRRSQASRNSKSRSPRRTSGTSPKRARR